MLRSLWANSRLSEEVRRIWGKEKGADGQHSQPPSYCGSTDCIPVVRFSLPYNVRQLSITNRSNIEFLQLQQSSTGTRLGRRLCCIEPHQAFSKLSPKVGDRHFLRFIDRSSIFQKKCRSDLFCHTLGILRCVKIPVSNIP